MGAETRFTPGNLVTTHPVFIIKRTGDYTTALDGDTGRIVIQDTDAFTVFNYCITNLPSGVSPNGGVIQVKDGRYYINNTLPIVEGMTILGNGIASTYLILSNNADCDMFAYDTAAHIYFPSWLHISLMGNKTNNTAGSGIVTNAYVNDALIFDVFIQSFSDEGIESARQWGWRIIDSVFEYNESDGIKIGGDSNLQLMGCKISENEGHGLNYAGGAGGVITNNYFSGNYKNGIYIDDSDYSIFSNNVVNNSNAEEAGTYSEIDIDNGSLGNTFVGNYIGAQNRSLYCIKLTSAVSCVIMSNSFKNAVTDEIGDLGSSSCIIRDNLGWRTESWGTATGILCSGFIPHNLDVTPQCVILTPQQGTCSCNDLNANVIPGSVNASGFHVSLVTTCSGIQASGDVCWIARADDIF